MLSTQANEAFRTKTLSTLFALQGVGLPSQILRTSAIC